MNLSSTFAVLFAAIVAANPRPVVAQRNVGSLRAVVAHGPASPGDRFDQDAACPGGWVDCKDGKTADGTDCADACEGQCCTSQYRDTCYGFTGRVCRDGVSCMGITACRSATIGEVLAGCNDSGACQFANIGRVSSGCVGGLACSWAGDDKGYVGVVENSCHGTRACRLAGASGGNIGMIENSCLRYQSCLQLGSGGTITEVKDSCGGEGSCEYAFKGGDIDHDIIGCCNSENECKKMAATDLPSDCASHEFDQDAACPGGWVDCKGGVTADGTDCADACEGQCCTSDYACYGFTGRVCRDGVSCMGYQACTSATIEEVVAGCNGYFACGHANIERVSSGCVENGSCSYAGNKGHVGVVEKSCRGPRACTNAGRNGGNIGVIEESCWGGASCGQLAAQGGNIMEVKNSCDGRESCLRVAKHGVFITKIENACLAGLACRDVGTDRSGGNIDPGIIGCCNSKMECARTNAADLPSDCASGNVVEPVHGGAGLLPEGAGNSEA